MGTINYRTSEYITLALPSLTLWDGATDEDVRVAEESIYQDAKQVLDGYDLTYFRAQLLPGYYDGFCLDLEYNPPVALDDATDKRRVQREVTQVGHMLRELVGVGLTVCRPGWCLWYGTRAEAMRAIREAVRAMREDVRRTPTWVTLEREEAR